MIGTRHGVTHVKLEVSGAPLEMPCGALHHQQPAASDAGNPDAPELLPGLARAAVVLDGDTAAGGAVSAVIANDRLVAMVANGRRGGAGASDVSTTLMIPNVSANVPDLLFICFTSKLGALYD
jgi:hypothetical protein